MGDVKVLWNCDVEVMSDKSSEDLKKPGLGMQVAEGVGVRNW